MGFNNKQISSNKLNFNGFKKDLEELRMKNTLDSAQNTFSLMDDVLEMFEKHGIKVQNTKNKVNETRHTVNNTEYRIEQSQKNASKGFKNFIEKLLK